MIERFVDRLRALHAMPAAQLESPSSSALRADAADAVRLQLDCMQQALTPAQRESLHGLEEALDAELPQAGRIHAFAREAASRLAIQL